MDSTQLGFIDFHDIMKLRLAPGYVGVFDYGVSLGADLITISVTRIQKRPFFRERRKTIHLHSRDLDMKTPYFFLDPGSETPEILKEWGIPFWVEQIHDYPQWEKTRT